jgi:hypothetical protein
MNCGDVEGDCDSYKGACRENKGQIGMGSCTAVNAVRQSTVVLLHLLYHNSLSHMVLLF